MCVYSLLLALTWHRLVLAPQAPRLARAWPPVLSPSARVSDKTRDGGVAERLKAHAWKVCMRETVSRVRIPPPPPISLRSYLKLLCILKIAILWPIHRPIQQQKLSPKTKKAPLPVKATGLFMP